MIVGHRGLGTDNHQPPHPENTVASLVHASKLNFVAGVEFDVQMTSDGKLIVYHDFDCLIDNNKCQISELNFEATLPIQNPEIQTLTSILDALRPVHKGIICEVKFPPHNSRVWRVSNTRAQVAQGLVNLLASECGADSKINFPFLYISSFDPDILVEIRLIGNFQILFNCWFGHENDSWDDHDFEDLRNRDPLTALKFAQTLQGGLVVETAWLERNRWFVARAKKDNTKIFTYGKGNADLSFCKEQIDSWGVDCVIADRVDLFQLPN